MGLKTRSSTIKDRLDHSITKCPWSSFFFQNFERGRNEPRSIIQRQTIYLGLTKEHESDFPLQRSRGTSNLNVTIY